LPAYEVSNHARPGAECRHNLTYWRAGDWLGIGPGAHGRHGTGPARRATVSIRQPDAWRDAVGTHGHGVETMSDDTDHASEYLMTALRLAEGLSRDRLATLGLTLADDALADLARQGLIHPDPHRVRPTDRGRALADSLAAYLAN